MASEHEGILFPEIPRVAPSQLAGELNENPGKLLVVDVRGEDFGAHVKGAINVPVDQLQDEAKVGQIVADLLQAHPEAEKCVFYCGRSQKRGPTGAAKFLEALKGQQANGPEVVVLEGGITGFTEAHPELVQP